MMLSPPTIAKELGCKPEKVISWIRAGKLPAVNLGDGRQKPRFRVSEEALVDFLAARAVQAPARRGRKPREVETYVKVYPEA